MGKLFEKDFDGIYLKKILFILIMLWKDVLNNWENGKVLSYPQSIKDRFLWNTSVLKNNGNVKFSQSFKEDTTLPSTQNGDSFKDYFYKSQNKWVVSFPNLSGDTMLVVPNPIKNNNYVTLKDFIDNAPLEQQISFWKEVASVAKLFMSIHKKVWISVHGHGVYYTHIRISTKPKYYFDDKLIKD